VAVDRRRLHLAGVIAAAACVPGLVRAADYPAKEIRLVVPYPPGGATDFIGRTLAAELTTRLGRSVVVENRPGAGTNIAAEFVARAPADGHVILLADSATLATNKTLYRKLSYDPQRDLVPVARVARIPLLLVAPADGETRTLAMLHARARAGEITYGSPGLGSPHHLAMALYARRAGLNVSHVPYKGAAPVLQDLLGGRLDAAFLDLPTVRSAMGGGRIKVIAVGTKARLDAMPGVSTLDESGAGGFDAFAWQGIVVPAGTPIPVVTRLGVALEEILRTPAIVKKLDDAGVLAAPASQADFARFIAEETARWGAVIRDAGLSLD
jgi:tripartite-type tricarboxylate transporter receptor subunit TctC